MPPDPSELTVDELEDELSGIEDVDVLSKLLSAEVLADNRKTAKEAIRQRIVEVEVGDAQIEPRQQQAEIVERTDEPAGVAASAADTVFALTSDDAPTEVKAQAAQRGLGELGKFVGRLIHLNDAQKQQNRQRAQGMNLKRDNSYPVCPECDADDEVDDPYQFSETELNDLPVRCPDCDSLLTAE